MPYGSMLHITPTYYHLVAKQKLYQKAYLLTRNIDEFSGRKKKSEGWDSWQKNDKTKRTMGVGSRPREETDSKVESNDRPVIPDMGETDIPSFPLGSQETRQCTHMHTHMKQNDLLNWAQ